MVYDIPHSRKTTHVIRGSSRFNSGYSVEGRISYPNDMWDEVMRICRARRNGVLTASLLQRFSRFAFRVLIAIQASCYSEKQIFKDLMARKHAIPLFRISPCRVWLWTAKPSVGGSIWPPEIMGTDVMPSPEAWCETARALLSWYGETSKAWNLARMGLFRYK